MIPILAQAPFGGEGADYDLLPDFLDSSKMVADIDAKLLVPIFFGINLASSVKLSEKSIKFFNAFCGIVLLFWVKNGKCLRAVRTYSFEVTCNQKMPNAINLNALQNNYL